MRDIFTLKNTIRALFLFLIVSLGFMQPFVFAAFTGGQRLTPADLLFPAVVILWIVCLLTGQLKFKWHKFYWVLGGYFAAMTISAVFSADARASFIKLIGEAYLIGLGVLTFNLIDDEKDIKWALRAWLVGAALPAAAAIGTIFLFYAQPGNPLLEYTLYHYGAVPVGNYPRVSSTFVSASMFCNYLSVCLVMLFIARKTGWIGKALFWGLLAAILVCAAFTISAGLGGIFLSIGVWIRLMYRSKKPFPARFALTAGIAIAVLFFVLNFFALQDLGDARLRPSSRVLVWTDALKTFSEHPVTGKGLGQAVSGVIYHNTDGSVSLLTDAHNVFLSVAAQNGLIGLAAILALVFYILRSGFRATPGQNENSIVVTGLALAFLSAFVYQGLTGSFEDARHLWVLIGMIPAARSIYDETKGCVSSRALARAPE